MRSLPSLAAFALAFPALAQDLPDYAPRLHACYDAATDREARLACADAVAEPCMAEPGDETTIGMSMCLQAETEGWDVLLNREYRATMDHMAAMDEDEREYFPEYATRVDSLRAAQRAWIAFRDAECALAYAEWGSGSHRHIAGTACFAEMTMERTIALRDMRERFE